MTSELKELLPFLTADERGELSALLRGASAWMPQPGPQTLAYYSPADILFYGGAAHGGKTDLLLGLARNEHRVSIIFRRISKSLKDMVERSRAIYAPDAESAEVNRLNEQIMRWRLGDGRRIYFDGLETEDDVVKHQGRSRDFYGFDELPEFSEKQFRFVTGWLRSTDPKQRCRIVCTGNPPTNSDGEWIVRFFGAWLDPNHPNRARPGELRWYTTGKDGKDVEMPNGDPFEVQGPNGKAMLIRPRSRTFIPALPTDNAYTSADYLATLNALVEPLRSKFLFGDFTAGREDDARQVIPSEWVRLAQARWKPVGHLGRSLDCIGTDVARGGNDKTINAKRYGNWIAPLSRYPGKSTPDGGAVAALVIAERGASNATCNIDVVGVGSSPFDSLKNGWVENGEQRKGIGLRAVAMNGAEGSDKRDKSGLLGFRNQRAEWYWTVREALDPESGQDIALPPDDELRADLCSARWKLTPRGIQIEAKDEIKKRIGRSPDAGDAVVNALVIKQTPGGGFLEFMEQDIAAQKAAKEQHEKGK